MRGEGANAVDVGHCGLPCPELLEFRLLRDTHDDCVDPNLLLEVGQADTHRRHPARGCKGREPQPIGVVAPCRWTTEGDP